MLKKMDLKKTLPNPITGVYKIISAETSDLVTKNEVCN